MNEKKRYAIENFNDIESVPCPCGMSKRAFVKSSNGVATFHQVDIKKDAALHYHKEHIELYRILTQTDVIINLSRNFVARTWHAPNN